MPIGDVTVVILAGGFGVRLLGAYPNLPKPMIPVAGRPFLEWVIRYWASFGARDFVLSLGHLGDVAESHFKAHPIAGVSIRTVREPQARGTGGAVALVAGTQTLSDPFFVANGDSLVLADPDIPLSAREDGAILAVEKEDASRYGTLVTTPAGLLSDFREKKPGRGLINAGVYLLRKKLLAACPTEERCSLETEFFPAALARGARFRVWPCEDRFLDIGTPESLAQAEAFIGENFTHTLP